MANAANPLRQRRRMTCAPQKTQGESTAMRLPRTVAAVVGGIALMTMAACGSSDTAPTANQAPAPSTSAMSSEFGPACGAVPKDGAGSFQGMAQDPVATAASNNPVLSTLVTAVKQAGLVDTLNGAKGITV